MALPATESFSTDQVIDGTGGYTSWSQVDASIAGNGTYCYSFDGSFGLVRWSADSFNADQYAQMVVDAVGGVASTEIGPSVRVASGASTCYYAGWSGDGLILKKVVAGTPTTLGTYSAPVATDLVRLEVSGTTLTVKVNGSTVGTVNDSDIASGSAGIAGNGGSITNRGDTWEAGNLSGVSITLMGQICT